MRLIDPKMSIDTIKSYIEVWDCKGCLPYGETQHNVMAVDDLQYLPTIEAEPVRRGHLVLTRDEQYEYCHCSECGYDTGENWMIGSEIPYCSQCGSKNYDGGAENG